MEQYGPLHELVDRHFDHHNRRPLKKIACAAKYLRGNVRALDVDLEQRRRPLSFSILSSGIDRTDRASAGAAPPLKLLSQEA
jgi:hypothetical protein